MTSPGSLIGLQGPPFAVPIERGKVREFATGTYARHPAYMDDPHPPIPPTFLAMAGYVWGYTLERPHGTVLEAANLQLAMTLHGEDEFVFYGPPPRAGDVLSAVTRVEDVVEKHGRRAGRIVFYVMLTEFRDSTGRLVAIDRTTSVQTERAPSGESADVTPPETRPFFVHDTGADLLAAMPPATAADLAVGRSPGSITFPPLTLTEIVRYQGAASDDHPMHHDDNHARNGGYPSCFSVGLLHVGAIASYGVQWLGAARVRRLKARFLALQWPGDRLTYDGRVARVYDEGGERRVDLDLTCTRQTGERTLDVAMTFVAG